MSQFASATWLRPPRSLRKEFLDAHDLPIRDLWENLDDLRRLNRYLGSHWIVLTTLRRLWRRAGSPRDWRILDIGTGAGDVPAALAHWSCRHGVRLTSVALDYHWNIVRYARAASPPSATVLLADGLQLPFRAHTFDVVLCSSMLHHLDWQDGITLLQAMASVARYGVVVNDLVRSWPHYYIAKLLMPMLAHNPLTRHDGPLSVLRAYCVNEVREMARAAGLGAAQVCTVLTYRLLLVYTHPAVRGQTHGT
jgi:ubiquinone/menaquinone biosynthesis C-methylase UbiE